MATVDHEAELSKAGANVQGRLGSFLYWCRSYPLGAIGALILIPSEAVARRRRNRRRLRDDR